MRRILAATLIGVLTGSLLTTVEPAITTPPPAVALDSSDCTPNVLADTDDDGEIDNPVGANPSYVIPSTSGGECVLKFVTAGEDLIWNLTGLSAVEVLVVGGGGGGGRGGGGAGGYYDSTASGNQSLDVTNWSTATVRVGLGGLGDSSTNRAAGGDGQNSWVRSSDEALGSPGIVPTEYVLVRGGEGGAGDGSSTAGRSGGVDGYSGGSSDKSICSGSYYASSGRGGTGATTVGSEDELCSSSESPRITAGGQGGSGRTSSITGGTYKFSGGGGGGAYINTSTSGQNVRQGPASSSGGGGAGTADGVANTGGGGGGSSALGNSSSAPGNAGNGGSGVVIVRFSIPVVGDDPTFGAVTTTPNGFEFEITNYYSEASDDSGVVVTWTASGTNNATASVNASGLVRVVFPDDDLEAVAAGATVDSVITVRATAASGLYSAASATKTGSSREAQADVSISTSGSLPFGGSVSLTASDGSGSGSFGDFTVDSGPCTVSDSTLSTTSAARSGGTACVVSVTKAGDSEYLPKSEQLSVTVADGPPAVVQNLSAVLVGTSGATVSWDAPAYNGGQAISRYAVTPSSLSCEFDNPTDTECEITGLSRGVTASISVAAVNSVGTGPTQTVSVSTPALPSSGGGNDDDDQATPVPTVGPTVGPGVPGRPGVPGGVPGRPGGSIPGGVGSPGVTPGGGTPPPPPGGTVGSPVAPERPGATVGGVPVPTTTTASPGGRGVSVSAGGVDVGVDVPDPGDGAGGVIDRGGIPEPVVTPGQGKTVSGAGAAPGSVVDVWLPGRGGNAPTNIAQIPVGEDGTFSADVDVFAGSGEPLPIGRNVVQIVTTNAEGEDIVVDMPFTLTQGEPAPEVLRATNETPNAPVVGVVATNKGEPEQVTIDSEPTQGSIRVTADAWDFTISVDTATSSVQGSDTTTTIVATNTTEVTVSGSGFMADTRVDVWAFSTPTLLASATVTTEGTATVTVELDPTTLTGEHTLQLQAVGDDGYVRTANLPVTLTDTPPTTTNTANSLLWWTVGLIALIILAAVVTTLVIRRRQDS